MLHLFFLTSPESHHSGEASSSTLASCFCSRSDPLYKHKVPALLCFAAILGLSLPMLVTGAALAWTLWMGGCINHSACACTLDAKAVLSWEDVPESFFDHNFSMFQQYYALHVSCKNLEQVLVLYSLQVCEQVRHQTTCRLNSVAGQPKDCDQPTDESS